MQEDSEITLYCWAFFFFVFFSFLVILSAQGLHSEITPGGA